VTQKEKKAKKSNFMAILDFSNFEEKKLLKAQ